MSDLHMRAFILYFSDVCVCCGEGDQNEVRNKRRRRKKNKWEEKVRDH